MAGGFQGGSAAWRATTKRVAGWVRCQVQPASQDWRRDYDNSDTVTGGLDNTAAEADIAIVEHS
jgi:hypothetical protein